MSNRSSDSAAGFRELAFLAMCHLDKVNGVARKEALALFWQSASGASEGASAMIAAYAQDAKARQSAAGLLSEWLEHAAEIDAVIEKTSERWRLVRMDVTDRTCMRLATTELLRTQTSKRSIVADAVRLASRYGSDRSARFVNGVVESIARALRGNDDHSEGT